MMSRNVFKDVIYRFKNFTPQISLTSGIVTVIIVCCALFIVTSHFSLAQDVFSLGTSAFVNGHVHKLLTYSFHHKTMIQLLLSVGVVVPLGSNIEKSLGTVHFIFLFLLLSTITGVLYTILQLIVLDTSFQDQVEGLVPVSLALLSVTTMQSRMTKAFLFGVSVPTLALPWLFLMIISLLVPHTVFLCNIVAIATGWIYGKGWFSMLDMSEARASILDKKMPFRLLRNIGVLYVPASVEEKKKVVHPRITPIPGSYPVQAYAPVSTLSSLQATEATPKMYEGWPHSSYTQASPIPHSAPHGHSHGYGLAYNFGFNNGHSYEHSHGHGCSHNHSQAHGHCHKHVFLDRNSHGGNDSCSQHSHVSPMNMHSGQPVGYLPHPDTFSRFPESDLGPTSVMIDPVAPVGFSG
ncbi:rhomboid domain-containing protein 2-like isoform X1 [Hypomesus transpacificus]|uniref:rhomboid domain-containing protein 2-like isoform X1 n=2 Tax=Hypomesus transpacificus TaxID=137520 RepID=UPI001F0824A7|nr:rhomboid domain-containing protein 2-like isoform X1 [Hypomesus transpacificus]